VRLRWLSIILCLLWICGCCLIGATRGGVHAGWYVFSLPLCVAALVASCRQAMLALFAFCILLPVPCSAANRVAIPEPLCVACANCKCDRKCLCPKASDRYVLRDGDYWAMYFVEAKPKTVAEVVAGTIRWAVPHRKPVWIAIPVDKGRE